MAEEFEVESKLKDASSEPEIKVKDASELGIKVEEESKSELSDWESDLTGQCGLRSMIISCFRLWDWLTSVAFVCCISRDE